MDQRWAKFGPNLAKRANFESRDPETLGHSTFLKVITTVRACVYFLESGGHSYEQGHNVGLYECLNGPKWAKFGPDLDQISPQQPILKVETRDFGS